MAFGLGFVQLPPDLDFADPETDRRCFSCESVLTDDGCACCEPRCLVEDSPVRFSVSLDRGVVRIADAVAA